MLFFVTLCKLLFFIPLTVGILDDDILYDIEWQADPASVRFSLFYRKLNENYSSARLLFSFDRSMDRTIDLLLCQTEKRSSLVIYQH